MAFNYTIEFIEKGLTYSEYRKQIELVLSQPAADEHAEKMRRYIKKNVVLMDEYDETYRVSNSLKAALEHAPTTTWVVITEGWCGDAAFNIPMMTALEKASPGKIQLLFYFRDSNLDLIDANLTDGGRSIPIVVMLNGDLKEVGKWGPRPSGLQLLMKEWKAEGLELKQIIPKVHEWYNEDGTSTLQTELISLIKAYSH